MEALRQKLKTRLHPDKIGYYLGMQDAEFQEEFDKTLNRFTHKFLKEYCIDGRIAWKKLAEV